MCAPLRVVDFTVSEAWTSADAVRDATFHSSRKQVRAISSCFPVSLLRSTSVRRSMLRSFVSPRLNRTQAVCPDARLTRRSSPGNSESVQDQTVLKVEVVAVHDCVECVLNAIALRSTPGFVTNDAFTVNTG